MPPNKVTQSPEHEFFETLFREQYQSLLRYAKTVLKAHGSGYVSVSGRAEDVVQETFQLAWRKREKLTELEHPMGWLCLAVVWKTREALREDRRWTERIALLEPQSSHNPDADFCADLQRVLSREEYDLLHKLYLEGWSYKELCEELGEKKSTLAMRVKRSKEKIQKYY